VRKDYKWRWATLWFWARLTGLAYLSACLALFLGQERLIFEPKVGIQGTPATRKLAYKEVWVPVTTKSDAPTEKMYGWWIPSQGKDMGTILYLHGQGDNISSNLDRTYQFTQLGFSVLLVDYRGYGKSKGSFPSEKQIYADASAIWDYAIGNLKLKPEETIIYGHSLGGAIAIELASKKPQAGGLIVQSSFSSMLKQIDRAWWSKLFPVPLLLTQKFDSLSKVKSLQVPVLYIHGTADQAIPVEMSRALYSATPAPGKKLILVANGDHSSAAPEYSTEHHLEAIVQFAQQSLTMNK
jgi:alpha-beta hydrolase superfamily lysophospholipase